MDMWGWFLRWLARGDRPRVRQFRQAPSDHARGRRHTKTARRDLLRRRKRQRQARRYQRLCADGRKHRAKGPV